MFPWCRQKLKHSAPCPDNSQHEASRLRRAHRLLGSWRCGPMATPTTPSRPTRRRCGAWPSGWPSTIPRSGRPSWTASISGVGWSRSASTTPATPPVAGSPGSGTSAAGWRARARPTETPRPGSGHRLRAIPRRRCWRMPTCGPCSPPAPGPTSRPAGMRPSSCCSWTAGCGSRSWPASRSPTSTCGPDRVRGRQGQPA